MKFIGHKLLLLDCCRAILDASKALRRVLPERAMERAPTTPRHVTGVARSKCFRSVGKRAGGAASEPRAVTNGSSRALRVRPWESAVAMQVGQAHSACAWVWRRTPPPHPQAAS